MYTTLVERDSYFLILVFSLFLWQFKNLVLYLKIVLQFYLRIGNCTAWTWRTGLKHLLHNSTYLHNWKKLKDPQEDLARLHRFPSQSWKSNLQMNTKILFDKTHKLVIMLTHKIDKDNPIICHKRGYIVKSSVRSPKVAISLVHFVYFFICLHSSSNFNGCKWRE